MNPPKILIVEDAMIVARAMKLSLEEAGYSAAIALEGEDAIMKAEKEKPDIVLMDITLGGEIDGIEAARRIMDICTVPVIYLTGNTDAATFERAKRTHPAGFLLKPVDDHELIELIKKIA
ncbi:MAG: response regulator [Nitrospirota bacterium]|jgi:CheY-like chemotaxis protein